MNNLKVLRLSRGLNQADFAAALGIHPVTYSKLENGWYARPPLGFEKKIREVIGSGWDFESLMKLVPEPTPEQAA